MAIEFATREELEEAVRNKFGQDSVIDTVELYKRDQKTAQIDGLEVFKISIFIEDQGKKRQEHCAYHHLARDRWWANLELEDKPAPPDPLGEFLTWARGQGATFTFCELRRWNTVELFFVFLAVKNKAAAVVKMAAKKNGSGYDVFDYDPALDS